ncbi:hypothetical protein LSAT2_028266 [Lamellibrachia satsuma]|nr:hypothetical protein LSAT2_028266 [Lamellibrachia satsuma]
MLKPAPLGIKPKDAGTDMIKFVRQHYISSNVGDRADVRLGNCAGERPDGSKVLKRSTKTYATELSPDWWDKRYRRTQYNFTCGAFSLPQCPYKSLGEVILDPNELVIDALSGSLPANFKRMYKKTDKERLTEKATSWANVAAKESKAKNLMGAGLYLSRQMEFNTAGMKQLKALLRESSLRIIATRGAQSYVDHVENCSKVKKDKIREQEEAETPGMVLRKLSSQSFFENGM